MAGWADARDKDVFDPKILATIDVAHSELIVADERVVTILLP